MVVDTLPKQLRENAQVFVDKIALREKRFGIWQALTWRDYYERVRNFPAEIGGFITRDHQESEARVAVLGTTVVDRLFLEFENPIDQTIRINGTPFRVIGILEDKGGGAFGDENDVVLIPLSTAQRRMFETRSPDGRFLIDVIFAEASSEDQIELAAIQIEQVLRDSRNIQFADFQDFQLLTQTDILDAAGQITSSVTLFLGVIAAISLLVGGIGIMNIMLVSVTERTREIGLRKAVGARNRDILLQFLFESTFLALAGGIVGILFGAVGAQIAEQVVQDLTTVIGVDIIVLATVVSASIGIFFGIYPAYQAARLNPIDALRYE
ncbi:MAG: FtsX-like permease family protein [Chloroflexi bacterium]|nr:FtsX-like permease family protein [Chloroflexota bacterium]